MPTGTVDTHLRKSDSMDGEQDLHIRKRDANASNPEKGACHDMNTSSYFRLVTFFRWVNGEYKFFVQSKPEGRIFLIICC